MPRTSSVKKAAKKTAKTSARKSASKKSSASAPRQKKFVPGTYTVPRGHVSIAVPTFWALRQTNEDLQIESPSGETSVIVTAYQRNDGTSKLDAREYLKHFLETAPHSGRVQSQESSRQKASARFRDAEGDSWLASFVTNGKTLLLATCNSNQPLTSREGKVGLQVVESLKLKARA